MQGPPLGSPPDRQSENRGTELDTSNLAKEEAAGEMKSHRWEVEIGHVLPTGWMWKSPLAKLRGVLGERKVMIAWSAFLLSFLRYAEACYVTSTHELTHWPLR